jgi:hypothetical protein
MKVRFYDNDEKHVDDISQNFPDIESILVPETKLDYMQSANPLEYKTKYNTMFPGNYFLKTMGDAGYACEAKYTSKAFTTEMIIELIDWCLKNYQEEKVVIFDWDRTLSCVEGFISLYDVKRVYRHLSVDDDLFSKFQLEYLMGGPDRLARLQLLFRILDLFQVKIYILSNNLFAHPQHPNYGYFRTIVINFYPFFNLENLISSRVTGGIKSLALRSSSQKIHKNATIDVSKLPRQQNKLQARAKVQQLISSTEDRQKQQGLKQVQRILVRLQQQAPVSVSQVVGGQQAKAQSVNDQQLVDHCTRSGNFDALQKRLSSRKQLDKRIQLINKLQQGPTKTRLVSLFGSS